MLIDHGTFTLYEPSLPPEHPLVSVNALFLRNEHGIDWYSLVQTVQGQGRNFVTVKNDRVSSLSADPSTLWPIDSRLFETDEPVDIGWVWTGSSFVDPASIPPSLDEVKAELLLRIDRMAEEIRLQHITPGDGQALTYDRKRREAAAAIVDPAPDADKYPVLAASIGIEVPSTGNLKTDFDAIANIVLAREEQWAGIAYHVEMRRLGGKRAIEAAQTIEDAQAAFDAVDWSGL